MLITEALNTALSYSGFIMGLSKRLEQGSTPWRATNFKMLMFMSAGIYMNNGVLAYSMNLEKKLKRRKNAVVIEEYKGDLEGDLLEKELQAMLDKHTTITKTEQSRDEEYKPLKYHWRNKITGWTHHSIYPHMNNIPNINPEEWEPYEGDSN